MALFFILAWVANIAALAVADWLFSGVSIDGWWPLLIGAAVLAIANTILKPVLTLQAGFEWASGCSINPTPPEEAAAFLRQTEA